MADEPSLLLSANAAAAWLGVSRATLWRRVADGTLPRPVKFGSLSRWPRSEIVGVIEEAKAQRGA